MPKHLIFTVGFEDLYFKLANMMCRTIRDAGQYQGDLIIFTTQPRTSPYASCINVTEHPDGDLLKTGRGGYFHQEILPHVDPKLKPYRLPYDYFMIKTLPGNFIDRSKYDVIYYFDSDMLIVSSLWRIFRTAEHIVSGFHGHTAAREMHSATRLLTPEELVLAKSSRAIGGGVVGVPKACFGFYEEFRKNYLMLLKETKHDMPALSLTLIKGKYRHVNLPAKRYWLHFWGSGGRKLNMLKKYDEIYGIS
jgi:hypothetical protein